MLLFVVFVLCCVVLCGVVWWCVGVRWGEGGGVGRRREEQWRAAMGKEEEGERVGGGRGGG